MDCGFFGFNDFGTCNHRCCCCRRCCRCRQRDERLLRAFREGFALGRASCERFEDNDNDFVCDCNCWRA